MKLYLPIINICRNIPHGRIVHEIKIILSIGNNTYVLQALKSAKLMTACKYGFEGHRVMRITNTKNF